MSQVSGTKNIHDGVVLPERQTGTITLYAAVHLEENDFYSATTIFEPVKTFEENNREVQEAIAEYKKQTNKALDPAEYPKYFRNYHRVNPGVSYYVCPEADKSASAYLPFEGKEKMFKNLTDYRAFLANESATPNPTPKSQPEIQEPKPETPQTAPKKGGESK